MCTIVFRPEPSWGTHARTHVQTEQISDVTRSLDRHHGRFQLSIPGNTAAIAMILMLMLRLILVHPSSTIHLKLGSSQDFLTETAPR
ncbi:hypothetical protein LB505_001385 [Fusarium chuoi]|nr:hypothetical protein LB505_001385 [Fusarium chuoi]